MARQHLDLDATLDDKATGSGTGVIRSLALPLAVTCLVAGGVFWIKTSYDSRPKVARNTTMQVRIVTVAERHDSLPSPPKQRSSGDAPERSGDVSADGSSRPPPVETTDPTPSERTPATVHAPGDRLTALNLYAVAAAAPSPPDLMLDAATDRFKRSVYQRISKFRRYPREARRIGANGTAVVRFVVGRDGAVSGLAIVTSAGHPALDQEAIATVGRAEPLPPIPLSLPARMTLTIPINFALR